MRLTVNQYAKALYGSTQKKSKKDLDDVIVNFLKILQKNNQIKLAKKIIEKFSDIWNKENGIVEAEVTSREELNKELRNKLRNYVKAKYKAKEVVLNNKIDEKIKGGVIIKVGDEMIDASIARKLEDLKIKLSK